MSRLSYQFKTASATSWLQRVRCDACGFTLERVGELPRGENDEKWPEAFSMAGWASFSMQVTKPPADQPELEEDLWPRLDRDFCPSCAHVLHDHLDDMGWVTGKHETKYLDALGRETTPPPKDQWGPGLLLCELRTSLQNGERCSRPYQHDGACSTLVDEEYRGLLDCCVCAMHSADRRRLYTLGELESHAVDQHGVRRNESGWYTVRDTLPTYFEEVRSALVTERRHLEQDDRHALEASDLLLEGIDRLLESVE